MSDASLVRRYWQALVGRPEDEPGAGWAERGRAGYSLWQRYWAALLNVRLPPRDVPEDVPVRSNPLSAPYVDGPRVRLPRFDRTATRFAATGEVERTSVEYVVGDRRFVLRESGPGQLDLVVTTGDAVAPADVVPIDLTGPEGGRRLLMVFVRDEGGGSVGMLRLAAEAGWLDVTVNDPLPAVALVGTDPAMQALVADSVRATPDPGMPAWEAIRASRLPGDPLRQVITDAAG
jgi:hypothetical protein